jgi:CBS domain-containing protein
MKIEEFMSRNLEYASMTDSLQEAVRKMTEKNVSSLVVVDMNKIPIGLVTERDIVRKGCSREELNCSTLRVSEIMSSSPITIDSDATPEEAAELFLKNKIRHLLVIDKNTRKAVGALTPMDFTRYREQMRTKGQVGKSEEDAAIAEILDFYRE